MPSAAALAVTVQRPFDTPEITKPVTEQVPGVSLVIVGTAPEFVLTLITPVPGGVIVGGDPKVIVVGYWVLPAEEFATLAMILVAVIGL